MLRLFFAIQLLVSGAKSDSLYPSSQRALSGVHTIAESGRSNAELLCLDTLAGNLARETPQLYRVISTDWRFNLDDGYHRWLDDLERSYGVTVDDSLAESSLQSIIANFQDKIAGYVRCDAVDPSTSAAITFAAAGEGLLVAADDDTSAVLEAAGVTMARDLRGQVVGDVLDEVLHLLSDRILVFQNQKNGNEGMKHMADYTIFARAPSVTFGSEKDTQATLLARATLPAAAFGWGDDEGDFVKTMSKHGVYVHASNWNKNLAALSNTPQRPAQKAAKAPPAANATSGDVHTVTFLMSDGDNLQFTLGNWATDARWFGSPSRGSVPMGWTFSPGAATVGPSILQNVLASMTANDELVAGPSGIGYMYANEWPAESRADFAALTFDGMQKSAMRIVNVLGDNDDMPEDDMLADLLDSDSVDAMFYFGDSSFHGKAWKIGGKPVITDRYNLWEEGTGDLCGVKPMIKKLKKMPKDPSSMEGYSVIQVHVWSHTYDDVVAVAEGLKGSGVEIVLPSEFVRRFKENVVQSGVKCHCSHPGKAAPKNGYKCSDSAWNAHCAESQVCATSDEFDFPPSYDFTGICQDPAILI